MKPICPKCGNDDVVLNPPTEPCKDIEAYCSRCNFKVNAELGIRGFVPLAEFAQFFSDSMLEDDIAEIARDFVNEHASVSVTLVGRSDLHLPTQNYVDSANVKVSDVIELLKSYCQPSIRYRNSHSLLLAILKEFKAFRRWMIEAGGTKGPLSQDVIQKFAEMSLDMHDRAAIAIKEAESL